jgi:hypothetical protein
MRALADNTWNWRGVRELNTRLNLSSARESVTFCFGLAIELNHLPKAIRTQNLIPFY